MNKAKIACDKLALEAVNVLTEYCRKHEDCDECVLFDDRFPDFCGLKAIACCRSPYELYKIIEGNIEDYSR